LTLICAITGFIPSIFALLLDDTIAPGLPAANEQDEKTRIPRGSVDGIYARPESWGKMTIMNALDA